MGILSGNPKDEPLHYGEVAAIWSGSLAAKSAAAFYSTMLNHAGDGDLKRVIEEGLTLARAEMAGLDEILRENGVAIPPEPPERPHADLESIPPGARIQDPEIASMIGKDIGMGLTSHSQAMAQCIREDIAMMFGEFHTAKAKLGQTNLRLLKEKGWLVVPPLHMSHVNA
ncbi:DUF3231 family protein [Domibacillus sp. PGB-M46]|uniref:DUF3231 family protein n=1 Tax=Domibacillus sp. PGB-M46 TaxID=2910255 RepID=UPI001F582645|nr:DUF3231 family protein [Domibacillus sp. PGB-M46]MCI2253677.1 DUF3231 family protein [Domibacillus sp. PGB-M46]